MNINTKGMSAYETFGYKTEDEMMEKLMDEDYLEANKKEVAMIVLIMKLQELGIASTLLVITVLNTVTGLSIKGAGELVDYFDKSLNEGEMIVMSGKITKIGGEEFDRRIEEASARFDAMEKMNKRR